MINNEVKPELINVVKRGRGRPKMDESLRKKKSKVRGRPKKFVEIEEDLTLLQQRYKDRYYYYRQIFYIMKHHNNEIPEELINLPQTTDEDLKHKACMIKRFISNLEILEIQEDIKNLDTKTNIHYKPRPKKALAL